MNNGCICCNGKGGRAAEGGRRGWQRQGSEQASSLRSLPEAGVICRGVSAEKGAGREIMRQRGQARQQGGAWAVRAGARATSAGATGEVSGSL